MKTIKLIAVAVIAGAVRYPTEGEIVVRDDEEAERLIKEGFAQDPEDDGLGVKTVPELKRVAEDEEIDLGDNTRKPDIINAIRAHRAANPEA